MKKNPSAHCKMLAVLFTIFAIAFSMSLPTPSFAKTKGKPVKAAAAPGRQAVAVNPETPEVSQLVQRLIADRLVDESKGFVVEKKQNLLFINGVEQTGAIANKYLANIMQTDIRVQVFSFRERLQMHPDAGIMELISPVWSSSGCVQYAAPKKPGC